jgi:tetratricopeptide (TPR) repeat protein
VDLVRERLTEKIALRRLDASGTALLITETLDGGELPAGLTGIVHGPTDGNPFFVGEIVRSMVEEGELYRENGRWEWRPQSQTRVPESVRAVLGQRLARLGERTRWLLGAASVLGQTFRFDEVERVSGLLEADVEAALEEAARAGLVREISADVYAFSHALAQTAVYAEITGRRQRRLHLAAAETIEIGPERERRAVEIASHFIQSGHPAPAIPHWMLAGDAARDVFAHTEAERHYHAALEASRAVEDTAQEAAALERLAVTLLRQGRYPEAEDCAREAGQIFRRLGDQEGELQAACRLAETLKAQGKQREALAMLRALQGSLNVSPISPGLAHLYIRISDLAMEIGAFEQQEEMAIEAVQIARSLGDRRLQAQAELYQQGALWFAGRPNHVFSVLQEYLRSLEEDGDLVQLAELATPIALMAMLRGELRTSKEYAERALDLAQQIADPRMIPMALSQLGSSLFLLGDWQGARAHLERAMEIAGEVDKNGFLTTVLCNLGHLTVCEGDWDAGQALLHQAIAVNGETDARESNQLPYMYLANLDLLRGDPQAAVDRLTPLLAGPRYEELWSTPLLVPLAGAHLGLGDIETAERLIADAMRRTETDGNRLDVVAALLVRADIRQQQGRRPESQAMLEDVVRQSREMEFPAAQAEAVFKLGCLALESGDREAAGSYFSGARDIWDRLGAHRDLLRVGDALNRLAST